METAALTKDGKILSFHNTAGEAEKELQRIQSQSFERAKAEGYDILTCQMEHKTKEEIFECKFCNAILESAPY